jgi:formylglycine-generating enzyme required for sulfatase activity
MKPSGQLFAVVFAMIGAAVPIIAQSNTKVDFKTDIAPILEKNCTACHHPGAASAHFNLTSRDELINDKVLVPGQPDKSPFYTFVAEGKMPPAGKLPAEQMALLRRWIEQDATWPPGVSLATGAKPEAKPAATAGNTSVNAAELAEVRRIRERILANHDHAAGTKTYSVTIPNTTVSYEMVAIPAGSFTMGSDAKKDEQPPHKVTVSGFWMQAHEVTWDEYRLFMFANQAGEIAHKDELVDGVSRPTRPYVEMSFGMGITGFPAISMTQHAANKYAEWLSAKTGEFYRLPTEAEWEYGCRAGSTTPYSFGSDVAQLGNYAWYSANSGGKYQKVATKKPNTWGLFDMMGNVMEWTLDQYEPYKAGDQTNPWIKPTQPYPIAVRGGSWNDPAPDLTCAARVASDPSWKQQDPQLPKSIWYETDAQWLGFRLIRPEKVPSAEELYRYWNNGVELDEQ